VPYARYGESPDAVIAALDDIRDDIADSQQLLAELPAGALRNGMDCALLDWRAQADGTTAWQLLDLPPPHAVVTAFTIGIAAPDVMHARAIENSNRPVLKVKLGGPDAVDDAERLRCVREGAPESQIIIDANEGWQISQLEQMLPVAVQCGVALIEQPLPVAQDDVLASLRSPIAIGADESVHTDADLEALRNKYDVVNIKLDKTGGLTQACQTIARAQGLGFEIMIGCMVATSLSMAPAMLLTTQAKFVDLDGPLLLQRDREPGLVYDNATIRWPKKRFWGEPGL
jgi:L-alanine-DL-glutamate epimerase-like enolase superfamily enzyme